MTPGSRKIEAVQHFPTPTNVHQVRQFLGLASFFRRFVPGFSIIAKALTQLLKKGAKWVWGTDQDNAFQNLKNILVRKPVLALYNPGAETQLHTDACKSGIAGILLQRDATVQNSDSEIQRIVNVLNNPDLDDITDIKKNFKLKNGRLFRVTVDGDRWVVPKGVRWQVVKQNHDDIGHFAVDKTLERVKLHYWFPKMRRFIKKYVSSCLECAYSKAPAGKKPGFLHPIKKIDEPFDTIHIDHVGPFIRSSKGNAYILVIIDAFTRFIFLKAVRNTKSSSSIKVLREYFGIFGVPR